MSAVEPTSAANDIAVPVTITGSDFATGAETGDPPAVTLGDSALTDVTFVDASTLTATVPWGMDPGVYALTVTNPTAAAAGACPPPSPSPPASAGGTPATCSAAR